MSKVKKTPNAKQKAEANRWYLAKDRKAATKYFVNLGIEPKSARAYVAHLPAARGKKKPYAKLGKTPKAFELINGAKVALATKPIGKRKSSTSGRRTRRTREAIVLGILTKGLLKITNRLSKFVD